MSGVTPMMRQYLEMKQQYEGCVLLFRLGDFYEMFFEDAELCSKILELTLTSKECGMDTPAPMCGVPYHAVSGYIATLTEKGYKVAICEQTSDPATSKGLVTREVVRVVTPGTAIEAASLREGSASYVLCVAFLQKDAAICYADVSTGEMTTRLLRGYESALRDEISRIHPSEIITNDMSLLGGFMQEAVLTTRLPDTEFERKRALSRLLAHFGAQSELSLGLETRDKRTVACGALMGYLSDTQKNDLGHISRLTLYQDDEAMSLDRATRRNLELTQSLRGGERRGSLLWLLDRTKTAMGARKLRSWVEQPLVKMEAANARLDAVEAFHDDFVTADKLTCALEKVYDMERLLGKLAYGTINARDCLALASSLNAVEPIKAMLAGFEARAVKDIGGALDPLSELRALLTSAIHEDAPINMGDGGIIAAGYSKELDEYRAASACGRQWILDLETAERKETGIKNLRIQYNRVFGYYIEVTKSNYDMVPLRYARRQTLANSERYITKELVEIERKIVGAEQNALTLETRLFLDIKERIAKCIKPLQSNAAALKTLDALLSLAGVAREYGYVRPVLTDGGTLDIKGGRHPTVERMQPGTPFVPNDAYLSGDDRMLIITGPNMAGKSTYMRQVALITIMAHIGSFVPADSAKICMVDRVFTRIGASDDIGGGQSTFMVEMSETAAILALATERSLIILDEIGRGTSTFDGLSIAWAVVEHISRKIKAKTLFATHYHELSELEGKLDGVRNYRISVKEHGDEVIFLRKIQKGGADRSYGVYVARLAGIPTPVVRRAQEILSRIEASDINQTTIGQNILEKRRQKEKQTDMFHIAQDEIIDELRRTDVLTISPMDALNALFRLREKARRL